MATDNSPSTIFSNRGNASGSPTLGACGVSKTVVLRHCEFWDHSTAQNARHIKSLSAERFWYKSVPATLRPFRCSCLLKLPDGVAFIA